MTDLEIIKLAVQRLKTLEKRSQKDIGRLLGYTNESSFSQVLSGRVPTPPTLLEKIKELGEDIKNFIEESQRRAIRPVKLEAKPLRLADPFGYEATGEKIYQLPDSSLIMQVPIIPYKAYASYLRGHSDPEFYEDLQTMPVPVDAAHKGAYLIFEVGGESMVNPGSRRSIWPGEKIIGRDLRKEHWKYKLHINSTDCWIIVHKYDGIVVKEIIDHNVDAGEITLHSWNPDKDEHPDYTVSLNDVEQIFNVVDPFNKFG